eukprot:COSAG06_NODE_54001_length_297_cov_0.419192_1_plen_60_part_01
MLLQVSASAAPALLHSGPGSAAGGRLETHTPPRPLLLQPAHSSSGHSFASCRSTGESGRA